MRNQKYPDIESGYIKWVVATVDEDLSLEAVRTSSLRTGWSTKKIRNKRDGLE